MSTYRCTTFLQIEIREIEIRSMYLKNYEYFNTCVKIKSISNSGIIHICRRVEEKVIISNY